MSAAQLPKDKFGRPIPVLGVAKGHAKAYTGTAAVIGPWNDLTREVITVYATTDCWLRFGASDVVATAPSLPQDAGADFYLPAGMPMDLAVSASYLGVVRATASGTLYVWERA